MQHLNVFETIRTEYRFKEIAEHYLDDELELIGESSYQPLSKECPWCGHHDCFSGKPSEEKADDIGFFHCFSCGKHASDGPALVASLNPCLNNYEAAEKILQDAELHGFTRTARPAGEIVSKAVSPPPKEVSEPTERQQALFNAAASFFMQGLKNSGVAMDYQTQQRRHSPESLVLHKVGLSRGGLLPHLRNLGFTFDEAVASGLVRSDGRDYFVEDTFVYAHMNESGQVRHFTMKDPRKKYQYQLSNSFRLGGIAFYGEHTLPLAKRAGQVILVEGENDFLSLVEGGCLDAVLATCGQISQSQLRSIKERLSSLEVVTFFDGDAAGDTYRERIASLGLPRLKQYVVPAPAKDPDEYLKQGRTFAEMLQNSRLSQAEMQPSPQQDATSQSNRLNPDAFTRADTGNADLLKALADGNLRYVIEHKAWAWFDGQYWRTHQDSKATDYAREVGRLRMTWAHAMPNHTDEQKEAQKKALSFAYGCLNLARINAMITLASRDKELIASASDFDNDPYLLGALNGVADLRTGQLLPFDPKLMLTKHCAANYSPESDSPLWKRTLERAFNEGDAQEAADVAKYLQKVFGMALIGRVLERSFFFIHGRPGTGKSLTTNAVTAVLKDYALELSPNSLMQSSYQTNDIKMPEIVKLKGVRFALASEADDGQRFNEALVKRITGQDSINARDLGEKAMTFKPQCTLFIVGNSRPSANGSDAFWQRLKVISFNNQVPKAQQDSDMEIKLLQEADGILTWLIQGCLAYQAEGLREPERVARDSAAYRADLDVISQFLEDRCELSEEFQVSAQSLYEAYTEWVENVHGSSPLGRNRFYEKLIENGFKKIKARQEGFASSIAQFRGLRLKTGHFPPF